LHGENARKFLEALQETYQGSLQEMIQAAFGKNFNDPVFWDFCKTRGIAYSSSTWSG
jgi:hypothetical protein